MRMIDSDLISRQAAIDALEAIYEKIHNSDSDIRIKIIAIGLSMRMSLEVLPSAQPENQVHLCDSCRHVYPECPSGKDDVIFGNGKGNDNICACNKYEPSAQPEQRWIPCSERLPEESGRYLVTRGLNACGSLWNRIYIANYSDLMGIKSEKIWWQGNVGKSDFERLDDVLAWMPLPEPYAERRTE